MKHFYEFGPYRLDNSERQLIRDGTVVALTPKAFDTLLFLVENHGRVLQKSELMTALWPGSFVEEGNLTDNISKLRQALGDDRKSPQYIETVARRGYRFIAAVQEVREQEAQNRNDIKQEEDDRSNPVIQQEGPPSFQSAPAVPSLPKKKWRSRVMVAIGALTIGLILVLSASGLWNGRHEDPAAGAMKSIAILPFKPLVDDERNEMFELGMADTLIARLSRVGQLLVRPTSAVRKYTRLDQDAVAAGREQRVDVVLDSSIQRSGERIRIVTSQCGRWKPVMGTPIRCEVYRYLRPPGFNLGRNRNSFGIKADESRKDANVPAVHG